MRRLALVVLIAALFGCATAPAPKFVGNSYHNNKYKFSLEKPAEWVHFEIKQVPKELLADVPPHMHKAIKIVLVERHSGSSIIIAADKADCMPKDIPIFAGMMQEGLVAGMETVPEVDDVKYCSGLHLTAQDACIEVLDTEGGVNHRMNVLMKIYPIGSQAKMLMVLFVSPEQVYDVHFPAFQKTINSLRCGEEYRTAE